MHLIKLNHFIIYTVTDADARANKWLAYLLLLAEPAHPQQCIIARGNNYCSGTHTILGYINFKKIWPYGHIDMW